MNQIVVEIPERKYKFFDELMSQFSFVQKSKSSKEVVYASIEKGLRRVNLMRNSKLPQKPIQKLFREV